MRILIGTIIFILAYSIGSILLRHSTMAKSEDIEWGVFKRVRVGKLSFLFDFRNKNRVRNEGIITPFFVMFLIGYATILALITMTIVYFTVHFEGIAEMDFTLLIWAGICAATDFISDAILVMTTVFVSKQRRKKMDNLKYKNL